MADKAGKTMDKITEVSDAGQQQQEQSDSDLIGGAANKTFGTGNKKK